MSGFLSAISTDPDYVRLVTQRLIAFSLVIDAGEMLHRRHDFATGSAFSWRILKSSHAGTWSRHIAALLDPLLSYPRYLLVPAGQLICGILLAIDLAPRWTPILLAIALSARLIHNFRSRYGLDGSDQMQVVILSGLLSYYLIQAGERTIALWFIAAQAMLSYATAGIAKLVSPTWRSGQAMLGILRTRSYGSEAAYRGLASYPWASRVMCLSVIIFECALPVSVLFGLHACLGFVAMGVVFHGGIAATMGLNSFFWSFVATYPSLLLLAASLQG